MSDRPKPCLFVSLEGGEGAGKSTQIKLLAELFRAPDREIVVTREPGGSAGAERIRAVLLDPAATDLDGITQCLLFAAARRDHMRATIGPALARGAVVLCDRFIDSTRAYQGAGGAVPAGLIRRLETLSTGRVPHLTLILDLPPEIGMARARARHGAELAGSDPFEQQDIDFHARIRTEFLAIAAAEPGRCAVIDAIGSPEAVFARIRRVVEARCGAWLMQ